jgi:hypothetical protein
MAYKIQHLGLGGILDQAIAILRDNFGVLFTIVLILIVPCQLANELIKLAGEPDLPPDATWEERLEAQQNFEGSPALAFASVVINLVNNVVLLPLANAAVIHAVARLYLARPVTAFEAIGHGFRRLLPLIGTSILVWLAIIGGLILLIIPGILFALWFSLSTHVVVLEDVAGPTALGRSKKLVRPHLGTLIVLGLIMMVITLGLVLGAMFIPQPHLRAIGTSLANGLATLLGTATLVVFYFSCRCAEENFDLHYLAEAIGAEAAVAEDQLQPARL